MPESPPDLTLDARVRALVDEAAVDSGVFIVDVVVRGRPGGRVVEVFADAETGAGLDDLAGLSRRIAFLLDAEDPISGQYRLDVSTPGAERPLADPRQFARHVGKDVRARFERDGAEQTLDGPLAAVTPEAVTVGETVIPTDAVRDLLVLLPW